MHQYEESPHSKERRLGELIKIRELNLRFGELLKQVRAENHQLELDCEDYANREDLQAKINDILVAAGEGVKSDLREVSTFINFAEKDKPHKATSSAGAVDKLKHEFDHTMDLKRKELRELALKICDIKVNMEKTAAHVANLGDTVKRAEGVTQSLQDERDKELQLGLELTAAIAKAHAELNAIEAECKQYENVIAEYHLPAVTKAYATKVVEELARKEADLAADLHNLLEAEKKGLQKLFDEKMRQLASEQPNAGEDELLARLKKLHAEGERVRADVAALEARANARARNLQEHKDALAGKQEERDRIVEEIEELKKINEFAHADLAAKRKRENELQEAIADNAKKLKAARDVSDIKQKEKAVREGRDVIDQIRRAIASASVDIQKEILEYQEILGHAEKKFEVPRRGEAFPFATPPGFDEPSRTEVQPQPDSHRRTMKKGTASAKKKTPATPRTTTTTTHTTITHTPTTPSTPAAPTVHFTPTPKKRKRDDVPVRITTLDPLYQRVIITNTSDDESRDISGWKLINIAYAIACQIPENTVLPPSGEYTFCPRPTEKGAAKKKTTRGAASSAKDTPNKKSPPPFTMYWESAFGARDVSWPMENARAALKDRNGNLVHEFSLGAQHTHM